MKYIFQVLNRMGPLGWALLVFALACSVFPIIVLPVVTIPVLVGILLILWLLVVKPLARDARLQDVGVDATAVVLGAQENGTSMQVGGSLPKAGMNILLEVHPPKGETFRTTVKAYVSAFEFNRVAVGQTVRVKYDPSNPSSVLITDLTAPLDMHQA